MSMVLDDILGLRESADVEDFSESEILNSITLENTEALTDLSEETLSLYSLEIAHECDDFISKFDFAVLAEEYAYLKNSGEELVWEGARLKSLGEAFKKFVANFWAKLTTFVKSVAAKVTSMASPAKKFAEKYYYVTRIDKVTFEGPDPSLLLVDKNSLGTEQYDEIRRISDRLLTIAQKASNKNAAIKAAGFKGKEDVGAKYKEATDKAMKSLHDDYDKLRANRKASYSVVDAHNALVNAKDLSNSIKDMYDKAKKVVKNAEATAKEISSKYEGSDDGADQIATCIKGFKAVLSVLNSIFSMQKAAISISVSLAKKVMLTANKEYITKYGAEDAAKKKAAKKAAKEEKKAANASYVFDTLMDIVSEGAEDEEESGD